MELEAIKVINARINEEHDYVRDVFDYWQTPAEFAESGSGDCEDFAIDKFFELTDSGLVDDVRMAYCFFGNTAHMVTFADSFVLDNLIDEILPIETRIDLILVYTLNLEGAWLGDTRLKTMPRLWIDLLKRMKLKCC